MWSTIGRELTVRFASTDFCPEQFSETKNYNINGVTKNTFIWNRTEDPELLYRNHEGKLFKVRFEPLI